MSGVLFNHVDRYRRLVRNSQQQKLFAAKVNDLKARARLISRFDQNTNEFKMEIKFAKAKTKTLKSQST